MSGQVASLILLVTIWPKVAASAPDITSPSRQGDGKLVVFYHAISFIRKSKSPEDSEETFTYVLLARLCHMTISGCKETGKANI